MLLVVVIHFLTFAILLKLAAINFCRTLNTQNKIINLFCLDIFYYCALRSRYSNMHYKRTFFVNNAKGYILKKSFYLNKMNYFYLNFVFFEFLKHILIKIIRQNFSKGKDLTTFLF